MEWERWSRWDGGRWRRLGASQKTLQMGSLSRQVHHSITIDFNKKKHMEKFEFWKKRESKCWKMNYKNSQVQELWSLVYKKVSEYCEVELFRFLEELKTSKGYTFQNYKKHKKKTELILQNDRP